MVLVRVDERDESSWSGSEPAGPVQVAQLRDVTRPRRITSAVLEEVARVWAESGSVHGVRAHFGVGERTAYRYVSLACQAGLIAEEEVPNGQH